MLEADNLKETLTPCGPGSIPSGTLFDVPTRQERLKELELKMGEKDFWNSTEAAQKIVGELKALKAVIVPYLDLARRIDDLGPCTNWPSRPTTPTR